MKAHRLGELRSLAYYRRVAERLPMHPEILERAKERLGQTSGFSKTHWR